MFEAPPAPSGLELSEADTLATWAWAYSRFFDAEGRRHLALARRLLRRGRLADWPVAEAEQPTHQGFLGPLLRRLGGRRRGHRPERRPQAVRAGARRP